MNEKNEQPNLNSGPESAPLKSYIKNYPITVNIYNENDELVKTEALDYGNYDHKKFLGKLSFWAWELGYTVETLRRSVA